MPWLWLSTVWLWLPPLPVLKLAAVYSVRAASHGPPVRVMAEPLSSSSAPPVEPDPITTCGTVTWVDPPSSVV